MREASIICPQADNSGRSLYMVLETAQKNLAQAFGGFTCTRGKGGWVNGQGKLITEPVNVLTVAYDPSPVNDAKLASVANYIGQAGNQEAVYVRYASGDVEIIDTKAAARVAA